MKQKKHALLFYSSLKHDTYELNFMPLNISYLYVYTTYTLLRHAYTPLHLIYFNKRLWAS